MESVHLRRKNRTLLKCTYMKPLTGKSKEWCKLGHELEVPLVKQFISDCNWVTAVYKAGLVQMRERPYIKDSIDFLGVGRDGNNEGRLFGVEVKGGVTPGTLFKERERGARLGLVLGQERRSKYEQFAWDEDALSLYLESRHEAVQILHHAVTYSLNVVVLLIGNRKGVIEAGIIMHFDNVIKSGHLNVLQFLFEHEDGLGWA